MKLSIIVVLVCFAAGAFSACTFNVGVAADITGGLASQSTEAAAAAQLALADFANVGDPVVCTLANAGFYDSRCTFSGGDEAVEDFFGSNALAMVGPACSAASQGAARQTENFPMAILSYGSSDPSLSIKATYPFFERVVPSDAFQARALIDILKTYRWKNVGVVYQQKPPFIDFSNELLSVGSSENINIAVNEPISDWSSYAAVNASLPGIVDKLNEQGINIIIILADADVAAYWFAQAKNLGVSGRDYQYLGNDGWAGVNLWSPANGFNLTAAELLAVRDASTGVIATTFNVPPSTAWTTLQERVNIELGRATTSPVSSYAAYAYDAVHLVNAAVAKLVAEGADLTGQSDSDKARIIIDALRTTVVEDGITGVIKLNSEGDRLVGYKVLNVAKDLVLNPWVRVGTSPPFTRNGSPIVFTSEGLDDPPGDGGDGTEDTEPGSPYWIGITCLFIILPIVVASGIGIGGYFDAKSKGFPGSEFD